MVITVPAYFDDAQRQGTGRGQTGWSARTAVAQRTHGGRHRLWPRLGQEGVIAVYDLGGGTFDISILRLHRGVFEVMATGGDSALGGDDFDHLLADWLKEQAGLSGQLDARTQRELLDAAASIKHGLTDADAVVCAFAGWQVPSPAASLTS